MRYRTLLAVSGGADSVAMVCVARQLVAGGQTDFNRLAIAHVHHGLRGVESDRDAEFVSDLAARHGFVCFQLRVEPPLLSAGQTATSHGGQGLEGTARAARYRVLAQQARTWGARFIATAHHFDDHVETILLRVLRGTGIRGMRGIPAVRTLDQDLTILRPLRQICRAQIESYLQAVGQPFCRDSMNDSPHFARNQIRALLKKLPTQLAGQISQSLDELSQQAVKICDRFSNRTARFHEATTGIEGGISVPVAATSGLSDAELVYALQAIWLAQNWPQQQMNRGAWLLLARRVRHEWPLESVTLPGRVQVHHVGDATRIARLPVRDG